VPAIALGFPYASIVARLTRASMLEVIRQDYVRTAWAKGLQPRIVIIRHALRNALIPVITILGPLATGILTGVVVIENIFGIPEQVTLWQDAWRRVRRNKLALAGTTIIAILVLMAVVSVFWTPYPVWKQAVGPTYAGISAQHWLGLDASGRDIFSRIMGGALISLQVGVGTMLIVSAIGIMMGLLAGFYRGALDAAISLAINIWYG